MSRIADSNEAVNILVVAPCSFTTIALNHILDGLQSSVNGRFNVGTVDLFEKQRTTVNFIICAGDFFNEMNSQSILKIKEALQYSNFSTQMIFLTSNPRFALSYFISRLCKKECYCASIDKKIEEISAALKRVLTSVDLPSKPSRKVLLTTREKEVIIGLIKQVKPAYLSKKYSIDQKTISAHKINALRKLNVGRLSEIINLNALT